MRVRNRTNSDIWVTIADSEPKHLESLANWSRYYSEYSEVNVAYTGNLAFPNSSTLKVRPNLVSTLDIISDGGAIKIVNNTDETISEVYLSNSDDSSWGISDLGGTLEPGANMLWTVTGGLWDIRIVDASQGSHFIYDQTVTINETQTLSVDDFSKSELKLKTTVIPATKPIEDTEERY